MPTSPPTVLKNIELSDKNDEPHNEGSMPPIVEPIRIPIVIQIFGVIVQL